MLKTRYSWPFFLCLFGILFLWFEVLTSSVFTIVQGMGWVRQGEVYRIIVFFLFSFGLYGLSVYYIWINRFPRDQRWLISGIGMLFPIFISVIAVNESLVNQKEVFTLSGLWCLALGVPIVIRMRQKPDRLKTKVTRGKYVVLLVLFAGGGILSLMSVLGLFVFSLFGGRNTDAILLYLLALHIGLPLALLLNMLDHHYRFLGKVRLDPREKLIDEIGG
jgi:hypothetical protein